jgi:hypothetical protein
MADIGGPQIQDFGALGTSMLQGLANANNANTGAQHNLASIPLLAAQTNAAQIANQRAALSLQMYQAALNDFSGQQQQQPTQNGPQQSGAASSPSGGPSAAQASQSGDNAPASGPAASAGEQPSDDGTTPMSVFLADNVDQGLRSQFFVDPRGTPQEQHGLLMASLSGDPGLLEYAKLQRDNGVMSRTAVNKSAADGLFKQMNGVYSADSNFIALSRYAPSITDHIDAVVRKDFGLGPKTPLPPEAVAQADQMARDSAAHIAQTAHQYTGREVTADSNGVARDKETGIPIPGVPQAVTPAQIEANTKGNEPVTLGDQLPVRSSQASGYTPAPGAPFAPTSIPAFLRGNPSAPAGAAAAAAAAKPTPVAPAAPTDPALSQALSDPAYRYQAPPAAKSQSDLAANTEQAKANVTARTTLKNDSDDATKAAAQAQTYLQAAKAIMDSKGTATGAYGALIAKASALMPGTHVDATNYQEVAKYLGNAALANARGIYGNRMTQSEVGLQLNELSPSVHMTDDAVNNLLNTNLKATQYTIDSARRVVPYLTAGNDATNFGKWNQQYFNQSRAINGPPAGQQRQGSAPAVQTATGPNGQKLYLRNGQWANQ